MAKQNKAPAPAAKVTVAPVPAPKAAQAPAPVAPAPAAQAAWQGFKHPVTQAQVDFFIKSQCGGNPALCGVQALPNMVQGQPVPFLRKQGGNRYNIVNALVWGFANGHTGPVPVGPALAHCTAAKWAPQGMADLVALLNGGFTASSKQWGQPFVQLVVLPAPAAPAAK